VDLREKLGKATIFQLLILSVSWKKLLAKYPFGTASYEAAHEAVPNRAIFSRRTTMETAAASCK